MRTAKKNAAPPQNYGKGGGIDTRSVPSPSLVEPYLRQPGDLTYRPEGRFTVAGPCGLFTRFSVAAQTRLTGAYLQKESFLLAGM